MKRVILDIDDKYAGLLTIIAIGTITVQPFESHTYVSTSSFDLSKGTHIIIGKDGKAEHRE